MPPWSVFLQYQMEEAPHMLGWLWNPGQNWERRMSRMEGCVWKKVDYSVVILQSKLTIQKGEDKKVNAKSFYFTPLARKSHHLVPVVQTLDSVISVFIRVHWIALSNFWTTGAWLTNLRSTVRSFPPGLSYPIWRILKGTQSIACV